jgi:hypothetical protein
MKKIARVGFGSIESNRKFWWVWSRDEANTQVECVWFLISFIWLPISQKL